ncbi:MAG: M23 family metallopeptidase [Leptospiraceae bacterium]|nr:M23 family metallopeptidase [Leptospiraceae bacterium]
MKKLLVLIFTILQVKCNLGATEAKNYIKNYFLNSEEEINFGRLAPVKFRYIMSSCLLPEYCGQNLFDYNPNSNWTTSRSASDEWVLIDFGSKRLLNSFEMEVSNFSDPISTYKIQVFHKSDWRTVFVGWNPTRLVKHSIGNIDASMIRVFFPKSNVSSFVISDIRFLLNNTVLTGISSRLSGYRFPINGGILPEDDYSLPGAPRKYRNGIHKGLDLSYYYDSSNKKLSVNKETTLLSIGDGIVVRADLDYKPITEEVFKETTEYNQNNQVTFVEVDFGGRQIWIDHGNGVMSSYNHLSKIHSLIKVGSVVKKGQEIGKAGNSGLLSEAKNTEEQIHLHLEIWIDGEFLGNDLNGIHMKKFLQYFFREK